MSHRLQSGKFMELPAELRCDYEVAAWNAAGGAIPLRRRGSDRRLQELYRETAPVRYHFHPWRVFRCNIFNVHPIKSD